MSDPSPNLEILNAVLETLDLVILSRPKNDEAESFRLVGPAPKWFGDTFGDLDSFTEHSPFLADFIDGDARECWQSDGAPLKSGIWQEHPLEGEPAFLEATALSKDGHALLILALVNERHNREQDYLQYAHDALLIERRLARERERKEVLLDCLVNDLSNSLATILMNIQYVEGRTVDESLSKALTRAENQARHQRELISTIAEAFDADLSKFEPILLSQQGGVDLAGLSAEAIARAKPRAQEKKAELVFDSKARETAPVLADPVHLTRILDNLLNYQLERSSAGDTVLLQLFPKEEDVETVITRLPKTKSATNEEHIQFETLPHLASEEKNQLGLYFCQMAIRRWEGRFEQSTTPDGGYQISFALRKRTTQETPRAAGSH